VLLRGDRIQVSHDMPQWGQSSEVVSWDASTRVLTLTDEFVFDPAVSTHVVGLTRPVGTEYGPVVCTANTASSVILDAASLAAAGDIDEALTVDNVARERNKATFGSSTTYSKSFMVTNVRPKGLTRVEVAAINYDERIGLDAGPTPDADSGGGQGGTPDMPVVENFYVTQTSNTVITPVEVQAAWSAARGADFYQLQFSYDNDTWYTLYEGSDTTAIGTVQPGTVYFRVAGFGFLRGPYTELTKTFNRAGTIPVGSGDNATSSYDGRGSLTINWPADASADYYSVTVSSGSDSLTVTTADVGLVIDAARIAEANGPWATYDVAVTAVNEQGNAPAGSTTGTVVLPAPTNLVIHNDWEGPDHSLMATWEPLPQFDNYTVRMYLGGVLQDTFTIYGSQFVLPAQKLDEYTIKRTVQLQIAANAGSIITGLGTVSATDTAPAVPSNIVTTSPSTGKVTIDWDALTDDDLRYYRVYASTSSGFTPGATNLVYQGTANSAILNGLPSGSTLYCVLEAVDYIESGLNQSTEFSRAIT